MNLSVSQPKLMFNLSALVSIFMELFEGLNLGNFDTESQKE